MGQNSSTQETTAHFTKKKLIQLFRTRCMLLLRDTEIKSLTQKLNITDLHQTVLTPTDLGQLLGLSSNDHELHNAVKVLYSSFKVLGCYPFLQDYTSKPSELTLDDLILASIIHTGRYKTLLGTDYDYIKLIFVSLALTDRNEETTKEAKSELDDDEISVSLKMPLGEQDSPEYVARNVNWNSLEIVKNFDHVDVAGLSIPAESLSLIINLFLILDSVQKDSHEKMTKHLQSNLKRWAEFVPYTLAFLRYLDVNIGSTGAVTYESFSRVFCTFPLLSRSFSRLFKNGLLSNHPQEIPGKSSPGDNDSFERSRLVNESTISLISAVLISIKSDISVSNQNLVKLYLGSESGFSIRSLESKIFKWQAPTLFIVSGKRLRNKTITTNRRYEQFNSEYPRYYRTSENNKTNWQKDNDTITYAVVVNQPWKNSNKHNFGDSKTVIVSVSPRLDYYTSVHSIARPSIYFNNQGLGLGFGNDQPVNKQGTKRYLPGDVSLTIEANLEFAVFRHLVDHKTGATYFNSSSQPQIHDFEDRFMITDLEVWGIGSTKELDEQRKQWEWEEKQAQARQSVNLKNLGEERAFLEMVGMVGNHNSSGGSV